MFSIRLTTTSPGFKYLGGVRAIPTPDGVPVKIRSPGNRGHTADSCWISCGTGVIMADVRVGPRQAGLELGERRWHRRTRWCRDPGLSHVLGVVQADREDLARRRGRRIQRPLGYLHSAVNWESLSARPIGKGIPLLEDR